VVVGRVLGTGSLGIYDMMYSVSTLPISEVSDIVARVTFPVYVKISDDRKRILRAYLKITAISGFLILPLVFLFLFFPEEIILIFLGPKWVSGANVLSPLSIYAAFAALTSPSGAVFYAVKKQKYVTFISVISSFVMFATIVPFVHMFGLVGAGYSVVLASVVTLPVIFYFLIKTFSKQ
jgi:O-antigen/teichoic acid export membrane protein